MYILDSWDIVTCSDSRVLLRGMFERVTLPKLFFNNCQFDFASAIDKIIVKNTTLGFSF